MTATNFEQIPVNKLELGMVIHGIGEQSGKLVVKNKGKVRHLKIIEQLSTNGVLTVIVERPQPISNGSLAKLNNKKMHLQRAKNQANRASVLTDLSIELEQASRLIKLSHVIHKNFCKTLQNNGILDISEAKELVSSVYESLARNPNALLCLSMLMHSNDYLANHAIHVAILMCYFAQQSGMSVNDCERLGLLGYLFDIGMVQVPAHILNKKAALSDDEQAQVQAHVFRSLDIVTSLKLDSEIMLAIEQHHERLNGSGYPNGFSGSKISKFSRILAIVDSYDALTTARPHQAAKSPAAAMKILSTIEHGYDPKIVLQFIRIMGIYPAGSLVLLSNKRIAVVSNTTKDKPSQPTLKVFYSVAGGHYLSPTYINLATHGSEIKIVKPIMASTYALDPEKII